MAYLAVVMAHAPNEADHDEDGDEWIIPSDEEFLAPEPGDHMQQMQENLFKNVETLARTRNGGLTPLEKYGLESLAEDNSTPERTKTDLKKVISNFGKKSGATAACKRAMKHFANRKDMQFRDQIQLNDPVFPLAKHLMMVERSEYTLEEGRRTVGCSCLAATYLMPEGCVHKQNQLHKQGNCLLNQTLCSWCSKCVRCQKLLGFCFRK